MSTTVIDKDSIHDLREQIFGMSTLTPTFYGH